METYEQILKRMQTRFENESGFPADDASDVGIRMKVLAGEIFSIMSNIEWLKREMFPQTATGIQLDKHAEEVGLKRKSAVKSSGELKFSLSEAATSDISVPKGTICATSGVNSIRFITLSDAVITAGSLSVQVAAEAEEGGKISNTNAGTIVIMVTQVQGVSEVTNPSAFSGGLDEETDDELRKRMTQRYRNVSNGTNAAFYKNFVLSYDGVSSASVEKLARGAGTLDVYIAGKGELVDSETLSKIQAELSEQREINVDVDVKNAQLVPINVYFSLKIKTGYDKNTLHAVCKDKIKNYFLSLGIGDTVYISSISNILYNTEGVESFNFNTASAGDVNITQKQLAVCGTITITDM